MRTDDIAYAKPQCVKFQTKREPMNPLNPRYKNQAVTLLSVPAGKFIRDVQDITDIEGAKPAK